MDLTVTRELGTMTNANDRYFDGRIVKHVRKAKGMTQRELAGRIGSSCQTISWVERNKLEPGSGALCALCYALDLQTDDFYTDVEPPVRPKAPTSIGEAIQQARLAAGIDQATLASRAGSRSAMSISHIETSYRRPSRKMAKAIASALGLAPEALLKFLPAPPELDLNTPPKNIGEAIRKARMRKDLTQDQLHRATGVSLKSLRRAETHVTCPRNESLVRLAAYLGEDVETFLRLARLARIKLRTARQAETTENRLTRQRAPIQPGQMESVPIAGS